MLYLNLFEKISYSNERFTRWSLGRCNGKLICFLTFTVPSSTYELESGGQSTSCWYFSLLDRTSSMHMQAKRIWKKQHMTAPATPSLTSCYLFLLSSLLSFLGYCYLRWHQSFSSFILLLEQKSLMLFLHTPPFSEIRGELLESRITYLEEKTYRFWTIQTIYLLH